jgi:hypothetical protein
MRPGSRSPRPSSSADRASKLGNRAGVAQLVERLGLPVLYAHKRNEVPGGYVKSLEVRQEGRFGSIILPAPLPGSKAAEIYAAAKFKVLDKFLVGGFWSRIRVGNKVKLICDRLVEISLAGTVTNPYSRASSVVAVQGIKGLVTDFGSRLGCRRCRSPPARSSARPCADRA